MRMKVSTILICSNLANKVVNRGCKACFHVKANLGINNMKACNTPGLYVNVIFLEECAVWSTHTYCITNSQW